MSTSRLARGLADCAISTTPYLYAYSALGYTALAAVWYGRGWYALAGLALIIAVLCVRHGIGSYRHLHAGE